jgi:hypothetical protein
MTEQTELERRYRRLLAWYPRAFRDENEQEVLAVLLACAPKGQRRPGLFESADLIRSGLWMRLRPRLPISAPTVWAAVRLMYAGALVCVVNLAISIVSLALNGPRGVTLRLGERSQSLSVAIAVGLLGSLFVVALWLWMARTTSQGRGWARICSTALFALASFELISVAAASKMLLGLIFWAPTWVVSAAATWLLWRPDSGVYFDMRRRGSTSEETVGSQS